MAQTIQLKRSSVAGNLPTSSDLALGEIAINTADGAVYIKKGNNDIVAVADNDILHIDTTNSRVQVGFSGTSIDNHARLQIKGFSGGHARITMQDVDGTNQKTFFQQNNGTTSISTQNDTNHGNFVVQGWNGSAQAEFMRVVGSTGNVGIGTTSPSQKFTVENNSGIFRINTSTSTYPRIEIGSTSGTTAAIINRTTSTQNIIFGETSDSGNYAFRGGNVGIGTTSPGVHLDIESSTNNAQLELTATDGTDQSFGIFSATGNNSNGAGFYIQDKTASGSPIRFKIKSNGFVGIGTTNPLDLLHLNSTSGDVRQLMNAPTDSDAEIKFAENGTVKFTIGNDAATDSFVIGTTNVDTGKRFEINSSGVIKFNGAYTFPTSDGTANQVLKTDGSGNLSFAAQSGGSSNAITDADGDTKIQVEESSDEDIIRFDTAGTERMTIGATGTVTTTGAIISGDDIILNNNKDVIFRNASGSDDGTKITRAGGNALRIKYTANSLIFDALADNNFQIRNSNDDEIFVVIPHATPGNSHTDIRSGDLRMSTTTVIDSSRNLVNIGTIGSGAITSTGTIKAQATSGTNRGVSLSINGEIAQTSSDASYLHLQRYHNGRVAIGNDSSSFLFVKNNIETEGNIDINTDSGQLQFGADNDMQIFHNGANGEINVATGSFTIDSAAGITLDADGGQVDFKDNGTLKGLIDFTGNNVEIQSRVTDGDLLFRGQDGSSFITALTLDMSNAGAANFNAGISIGGTEVINSSRNLTNITNLVVDNIDLGGSALTVASGDFTVDVAGDIILDADGADFRYKDAGTEFLRLNNGTTGPVILSPVSDKDLVFKGNDGGSEIVALTLDMSDAGKATFNHHVDLGDNKNIRLGDATDLRLFHNATDSFIVNYTGHLAIRNNADDKDIFISTDDGSGGTADYLRADGSTGELILYHYGSEKLKTTSTGINVTGHIQQNNAQELRGKDTSGNVKTLVRVNSSNELEYGWSGNGKVKIMGGGSYTERFSIGTDGNTTITGNLTISSNSNYIATRQILARDTNGLSFKTSGGGTTMFYTNAGDVTVSNNLTVSGNLTVDGTTTTLNTATLDVEDKNITLNKGSGDTSGSANGAGITIQDAVDASNDATILWDATDDEFDFSHGVTVAGNISPTGDIFGTSNFDIRSTGNIFHTYGDSNSMFFRTVNGTNRLTLDNSGNATFGGTVTTNGITMANGGDRSLTGPQNEDLIINARPNDTSEGLHLQIGGTDKLFIKQDGIVSLVNTGLLIDSGGYTPQDAEGQEFKYYLVSQGTDQNYKKVADVTISTGSYKALALRVVLESQFGNFGNTTAVDKTEYVCLFYRSGASQDDQDTAEISGQDPSHHNLRIVKTATGVYELQVRQNANYRDAILKLEVLSTNGGSISIQDGNVNGSTSGTITTPSTVEGKAKYSFNEIDTPFLNIQNDIQINGTQIINSARNLSNIGTISATGFSTNGTTGTFSNTTGSFPLVTSTAYDYVAKFESTDAAAFIILEDNSSTNNGNRVGVSGDTMEFYTAGSKALSLSSGNAATFEGTIGSGAITSSADLTVADNIKATGNNLKLFAGGNHIINMDLNGNFYPQTHNAVDLGFSDSLAFRNLHLVGAITGGATITSGKIEGTTADAGGHILKTDSSTASATDVALQLRNSSSTYNLKFQPRLPSGNMHSGVNANDFGIFTSNSQGISIGNNDKSLVVIHPTDGIEFHTNNTNRFNITTAGNFQLNGTTVIDASRNLTNIGTISSGNITSSGTAPIISLSDTNNAGGGAASGILKFKNTGGDAMAIGYTADSTVDSDMIISTNAGGTYGGYLGLDASGITDSKADIILEPKTNVFVATGDVGIGQQLPKANLNSNTSFMPVDSNGKFLTINGGGNGAFIMLESSTTTAGDQLGGLFWTRTGGQGDAHKQVAGIDGQYEATSLGGGILRFFTKPTGNATSVPRMQIDAAGNIKVGTTQILDQSRNLSNIGTYSGVGNSTFRGSGANSTNAIQIERASDNAIALRVQNSGEVVVENNYLYASHSGTAFYVQGGAVFRGGISNDTSGQPVTFNDDISVSGGFNATSAGSIPSIRGGGSYGGGIGLVDTNTVGMFADSNGGNLKFFTNQSSSDTATSRVALTLDSSKNATFAGTISSGDIISSGLLRSNKTSFPQLQLQDASNSVQIGHSGNNFFIKRGDNDGQIRFRNIDNTDPFIFDLTTATPVFTTTGTISSGAITSTGRGTFTADQTSTNGTINLLASTNGNGAGIAFSDNGTPSTTSNQRGHLTFYHGDTQSFGSGASFRFETSESTLSVLVDGKLLVKDGILMKPSSGTGAGTQILDSSRNLTNINRVTTADGINDAGSAGSSTIFNESGSTADFRIESDSNTHMFFLDGGNNAIGINRSNPSAPLDVDGGNLGGTSGDETIAAKIRAGRQNLVFKDTRTATGTDWSNATFKMIAQIDATNHQSIDFVNDSSFNEHIDLRTGNQVFNTRFHQNGRVGIGTTDPFSKLSINSNGAPATSGNVATTGLTIHNGTGGTAIQMGTNDSAYSYIQSTYVNASNNKRELRFILGDTTALTLDTSTNAVFGGNISIGGTSTNSNYGVYLQNNHWLATQYSSSHDVVRINANTAGGLDIYNQTDSGFANIRVGSVNIGSTTVIDGSRNFSNIASLGVGGSAGTQYPGFFTSGQRYLVGLKNTASGVDDSYPWLVHDNSNSASALIVHFNGVGDKLTLQENGDLIAQGTMSSVGGQFTSSSGDASFRRAGSTTARIRIESGTTTSDQAFHVGGLFTAAGGSGTGTITHAKFGGTSGRELQLRTRSDIAGGQHSGCAEIFSADTEGDGGEIALTNTGGVRLFIDGDGKVGIGDTSPAQRLHVVSGSTNIVARFESTDTAAIIQIKDSTGTAAIESRNDFRFKVSTSTEQMRLTTAGALHVEGDVTAFSTTVSDERLKDDVVSIDSALDKVMKLRGVEYIWNKGSRKGQKDLGVIAQEVEKVLPEIVKDTEMVLLDEETYKTVDYEKLTAVLIEAVKEQQEEIEKLKEHSHPAKDMSEMKGYEELVARINKLENKNGNN